MSARTVLAVTTVNDDLQKFGRVMNPKRIRIARSELPPHTRCTQSTHRRLARRTQRPRSIY